MNARVGHSPLDSRLRGNDEKDKDDEGDKDDSGWVFGLGAIRRARTLLEHEGGHRMLETQADAPDWRVRKIRC